MRSFDKYVEAQEWGLFYGILAVIWILNTWELYLLFRQWRVVNRTKTVPNLFAEILPVESFSRARHFNLDILMFLMVKTFLDILTNSVILLFDVLPALWVWSHGISEVFEQSSSESLMSIFFVAIGYTVVTLYALPLRMYVKFVIQNRYGINKETLKSFLIGTFKCYLMVIVILSLCTWGLVSVVQLARTYFFIYIWLFHLVFVVLFLTIFMNVIYPRMGNFKPLAEGDLKESIRNLASRVDFPLAQILVYEASATSTASNAYFYGFCGSKRIVLYDTLLAFLSIREIVAVVAHELGHWKGNHSWKYIILQEILKKRLQNEDIDAGGHFLFPLDLIYRAFDFPDSKPIVIGLIIIFQYIFILNDYVFSFVIVSISRYFEFEADAFAMKLDQGKYLSSALIKLYESNLAFPLDDWLFSMFTYNHPTLMERLKKLPHW